jgi:hypothetical protein
LFILSRGQHRVPDGRPTSIFEAQHTEVKLAFVGSAQQFDTGDGDRRRPEPLESEHWTNVKLYATVILFDQIIQILVSAGSWRAAFISRTARCDVAAIQCMVLDFALQQGTLASRTLEIDTTDHIISGGGRIDLSREVVEMTLRTDPKHFTIGKLATPIVISGPFKDLHYAPEKELAIRGGIAAGPGVLFPPAALLPTMQFGVGDNSPCTERTSR